VLAVWLLLVVVAVGADRTWGGAFTDSFELPGTDAQAGADLLADQQAGVRGIAGQLVFYSPDAVLADDRQAIDATVAAVADLPEVVTVSDPFAVPAGAAPGGTTAAPPLPATVSADGRTAYATVRTDAAPAQLGDDFAEDLAAALTPAVEAGLEVSLGGPFAQLERDRGGHLTSEAIGLVVALVVLLLAFGSVLAAVTPLLTGLFAVVGGLGLLGLVAALSTVPSSSPT
nr:MMPL family transporter [Micromonospora sp. DSM 115978]